MMNNDDINSMIIIGWLVVIAAEAEWVVQKLEYRYSLFAIRFYSFYVTMCSADGVAVSKCF